jgi:enoyl-CoA hydratase
MSTVTYALEGSTAVLRMDDGKANALSDAMIADLVAAIHRAEGEAKALILTGRPERFCAGFDLKTMMSGPGPATALLRRGSGLLLALYETPLPLVIACTGHALAGGALVVLTGDVRIAADGPYRIGLNEVSIGMPVPVLAMELARDRLTAFELVPATLASKIYDPQRALAAGYVDEVLPADAVMPRALAEAARLGAMSRIAYHATKQRLRGPTVARIRDTLEDDLGGLLRLLGS